MAILSCIYAAKYLVSANAPPVEGGAFVVQGSQIIAVGRLAAIKRTYPAAATVDFGDAIISPLLVNAHTHLELTDYPDWCRQAKSEEDPESFVDWILQLIAIKRNLSAADYRKSLKHGIEQSLAAGTGAVGDILSQFDGRDVYAQSPLSGYVFLETLGHHPDRIRALSERLHCALDAENCGPTRLGVSPHSPYTISPDYLSRIYAWCRNNGCSCSTHLAESPEEVQFIEQGRGALVEKLYPAVGWQDYVPQSEGLRPVEYLSRHGGLFPKNLLVHGVQLLPQEILTLAEKGMSLVLCPRSNAQLGVGRAPAGELYRRGVKLALGTDSLSSCDNLSLWDEMAFAHNWFAGDLDAPTLYHLATLGGAEVLGLESSIGSLEAGKSADFQVLQPERLPAETEIFDYFVSSGCTVDIIRVYHHGERYI